MKQAWSRESQNGYKEKKFDFTTFPGSLGQKMEQQEHEGNKLRLAQERCFK
jgi:hypothetical protein